MGTNKKTISKIVRTKEYQEVLEEQKNQNKFNHVTQKNTPENQNQEHNVRKEGIGKMNQLK